MIAAALYFLTSQMNLTPTLVNSEVSFLGVWFLFLSSSPSVSFGLVFLIPLLILVGEAISDDGATTAGDWTLIVLFLAAASDAPGGHPADAPRGAHSSSMRGCVGWPVSRSGTVLLPDRAGSAVFGTGTSCCNTGAARLRPRSTSPHGGVLQRQDACRAAGALGGGTPVPDVPGLEWGTRCRRNRRGGVRSFRTAADRDRLAPPPPSRTAEETETWLLAFMAVGLAAVLLGDTRFGQHPLPGLRRVCRVRAGGCRTRPAWRRRPPRPAGGRRMATIPLATSLVLVAAIVVPTLVTGATDFVRLPDLLLGVRSSWSASGLIVAFVWRGIAPQRLRTTALAVTMAVVVSGVITTPVQIERAGVSQASTSEALGALSVDLQEALAWVRDNTPPARSSPSSIIGTARLQLRRTGRTPDVLRRLGLLGLVAVDGRTPRRQVPRAGPRTVRAIRRSEKPEEPCLPSTPTGRRHSGSEYGVSFILVDLVEELRYALDRCRIWRPSSPRERRDDRVGTGRLKVAAASRSGLTTPQLIAVSQAAKQYTAGASLKAVASRDGVDARTIAREFVQAGIPIRPRRGWPPRP
ncbi:MAG: hypothetical protein R2695_08555 [Acidimicrobiales bacterium]